MTKEELKARLQGERYRKPDFWDKHFAKVFWIFGLLMIVGGLALGVYNYYFMKRSIRTEGEVIRLDGGAYRQGYAPVIRYFDGKNQEHLFYSTEFSRPPQFKVGEKLDMYYLKDSPDESSMGYSLLGIGVLTGIGAVFLLLGILFQKFFKIS